MQYRPNCNETFASWMGPKMVLTPNTPLASAARSSRMAEYLRNVVVIPCCWSKTAGRLTRNCLTSTDFENPASRGTSRRLLNSTEVFWVKECGPFLETWSNKSLVSCLVSFNWIVWNVETGVWRNIVSFTSLQILGQSCSVDTELIDWPDGFHQHLHRIGVYVAVNRIVSFLSYEHGS